MNRIFHFFIVSLCCLFSLPSLAQTDNYAVAFNGSSNINFGKVTELSNLSEYTIQFWICPSEWKNGAFVCQRGSGDNLLGISLGATPGNISFRVGAQSVDIVSEEFEVGKWVQLTLIVNQDKVTPPQIRN